MEHGPVPSTIYEMLKEDSGEPDEVLHSLREGVAMANDGNKRRVHSKGKKEYPALPGSDVQYLEASAQKYGRLSFGQLKTLAHNEPAYAEAEENFGLNNEMNLVRWAEEIPGDTRAIAAHVDEPRKHKA